MKKSNISKNEYDNIHTWLRYHFGKPKSCEHCGVEGKKVGRWSIEWALKKGNLYAKDRDCFIGLCSSCHRIYDWGDACAKGHLYTQENTYIFRGTRRVCKVCNKSSSKKYVSNNPGKSNQYLKSRNVLGLCRNCSNPLVNKTLCEKCRIKACEYKKNYRDKMRVKKLDQLKQKTKE